ncbi:MAG: glycosyltransferase family 4 protein, partial [Chloroflexota bacterium]|nr:glycosyltransferase family 4 protein [Chloroflexota bacterium]
MPTSRNLNIAIVISSFLPDIGGAQITAHNLALHLTDQGHRVVMFSAWSSWRRIGNHKNNLGYQLLPLLPGQQRLMPTLGWVYRIIQNRYFSWMQQKYEFDLWQSFGAYPAAISVAGFTHQRNIPHVLRTVGYDIQKDPEIKYGYRFDAKIESLIQEWSPKVSKAVALSESVKLDLNDVGVPDAQIEVIPCGVDQPRFQSTETDIAATRNKYGIPTKKFTYITVGRNHPKKGFTVLLNAVAEMNKRHTLHNVHIVFVGRNMSELDGPARDLNIAEHITLIEELGLEYDNHDFKIPSRTLIELYKSADACVFPSLVETFAMINIEAMAAEIPLISTDAPGCIETIFDGVDGLVAKAGDPIDL